MGLGTLPFNLLRVVSGGSQGLFRDVGQCVKPTEKPKRRGENVIIFYRVQFESKVNLRQVVLYYNDSL